MDGSDVIAALGGKFSKLETKIDAIFASLQRRTIETWNDFADFGEWVRVNLLNSGVLELGQPNGVPSSDSYSYSTTESVSNGYSAGIKVSCTQDAVLTKVSAGHENSSGSGISIRVIDIAAKKIIYERTYASDDVKYDVNVALKAGKDYYIETKNSTGGTLTYHEDNSESFPLVVGALTVLGTYKTNDPINGTPTIIDNRVYGINYIESEPVTQTGILTGSAVSPLIDASSLFNYDLIDYIINSNDGSYQVDILDSDDGVLLADVQAREVLTSLNVEDVKIKITLNRALDTDASPEIKLVSLAYVE
mgnify:CR=1 FL=1